MQAENKEKKAKAAIAEAGPALSFERDFWSDI